MSTIIFVLTLTSTESGTKPILVKLVAKKMSLRDTVPMNSKIKSSNIVPIVSGNNRASITGNVALITTNQVDYILNAHQQTLALRQKVRVSRGLSPDTFLRNFGIMDARVFHGQKTIDLGGGFGGLAKIVEAS